MTRNEIMRMAKQAGGRFDGSDWRFLCDFDDEELERFAALVAAAEREACAQVCESEEARALYNFDNDLEANRHFWNGASQSATSCAESIRARSTA